MARELGVVERVDLRAGDGIVNAEADIAGDLASRKTVVAGDEPNRHAEPAPNSEMAVEASAFGGSAKASMPRAVISASSSTVTVSRAGSFPGEERQDPVTLGAQLGEPLVEFVSDRLDGHDDAADLRRRAHGEDLGFERLRVPLPAVVTVAETAFAPRYPTIVGRRRAKTVVVERLDGEKLALGPSTVGLAASPTKVAHIEPVQLPDRSCRFVGSDGLTYDGLIRALADVGAIAARADRFPVGEESAGTAVASPAAQFLGDPSVWVVCELTDGKPARVSLELLSKATELAPALGGGVAAVVAGDHLSSAVDELVRHGVDVVFVAEDEALDCYRAEPHARVVAQLARDHRPTAVLFGATTTGRDLAPRVAAMLDTGLAADCTDLTVAPWERRGTRFDALLHQIRPAMAGGVLATCVCPEARPQMATVRPGVFELRAMPRQARIEAVSVALERTDLRVDVIDRETSTTDVGLAAADVIISGGAGCDRSSWHLVEELAETLGGRVAASRGAVEAGLAPRSLQVGQTGTTVHPLLYVACGISGALQHAVGMRTARTVLAINRDPDAFIFHLAHFGIIADVRDALPQLTAALRRVRH